MAICVEQNNLEKLGYSSFQEWLADKNNVYVGKQLPFMEETIFDTEAMNYQEYYIKIKNYNLEWLKGKNLGCWCNTPYEYGKINCHCHVIFFIIYQNIGMNNDAIYLPFVTKHNTPYITIIHNDDESTTDVGVLKNFWREKTRLGDNLIHCALFQLGGKLFMPLYTSLEEQFSGIFFPVFYPEYHVLKDYNGNKNVHGAIKKFNKKYPNRLIEIQKEISDDRLKTIARTSFFYINDECTLMDKFYDLKNRLNETKNRIFSLTGKDFSAFCDQMRPAYYVKGKRGIIATQYGGEIVSNAWLKMREILLFMHKLDPFYNVKSFSVAEAPGNFLLSMNHFFSSRKIPWEWHANSFVKKDSIYLDDEYGLMKKYPEMWHFGFDDTGDITNPDNILTFEDEFAHDKKPNLFTSDVKYSPKNPDYENEDLENKKVHIGHVMCCLKTLSNGGSAILKDFGCFSKIGIDLLFILSSCFSKVLMFKPKASRDTNGEIYLICIEYSIKMGAKFLRSYDSLIYKLLKTDMTIDSWKNLSILKTPKYFCDSVYECQKYFTNLQIESLKKYFEMYNNHNEPIGKNQVTEYLNSLELSKIGKRLL